MPMPPKKTASSTQKNQKKESGTRRAREPNDQDDSDDIPFGQMMMMNNKNNPNNASTNNTNQTNPGQTPAKPLSQKEVTTAVKAGIKSNNVGASGQKLKQDEAENSTEEDSTRPSQKLVEDDLFFDLTFEQAVSMGYSIQDKNIDAVVHVVTEHKYSKYEQVQNIPDEMKKINNLLCRVCATCNAIFVSSSPTALPPHFVGRHKDHFANCRKSGGKVVSKGAFAVSELDRFTSLSFNHSTVSANALQTVFQAAVSVWPQQFANASSHASNLSKRLNAHDDASVLWRDVLALEKHLTELLKDEHRLTILVDGGSHNGVHIIVTAVCAKEKVFILHPQVVRAGGADASTIKNAITEALGTVGKEFKDVGFLVADAASPNKVAFRKIQEELRGQGVVVHFAEVVAAPADQEQMKEDEDAEAAAAASGTAADLRHVSDFENSEDSPELVGDNDFKFAHSTFLTQRTLNGDEALHDHLLELMVCIAHYLHNVVKWTLSETKMRHNKEEQPFRFVLRLQSLFNNGLNNDMAATKRNDYILFINTLQAGSSASLKEVELITAKINEMFAPDAYNMTEATDRRDVMEQLFKFKNHVFPNPSEIVSVSNVADILYGIHNKVFNSNVSEEKDMNKAQAKSFSDAVRTVLVNARTSAQVAERSAAGHQSTPRFVGQTRIAHSVINSIEHLHSNTSAILAFIADIYSKRGIGALSPSLKSFLALLSSGTENFITESKLYLVSMRPIGKMLKKYSEHIKNGGKDVYDDFSSLTNAYRTLRDAAQKVLDRLSGMDIDEKQFYNPNPIYLEEDFKEDEQIDKRLKKMIDSANRKNTDQQASDEENENSLSDEDADENPKQETEDADEVDEDSLDYDGLVKKVIKDLRAVQVCDSLIFDQDEKKLIRIFSSRRACSALVLVATTFVKKLGEQKWKEYQPDIEYQNSSTWFLCKLLHPSTLAKFAGRPFPSKFEEPLDKALLHFKKGSGLIDEDTGETLKKELNQVLSPSFCTADDRVALRALSKHPQRFWEHPTLKNRFTTLRELSSSFGNVAGVVTIVDSFFSVTKAIINQRRPLYPDPRSSVLMQAFLHANGDIITGKNPFLPAFFTDNRSVAQRRKDYEEEADRNKK